MTNQATLAGGGEASKRAVYLTYMKGKMLYTYSG